MNYSIIKDEEKFRDFIDWLPDLNIEEIFYVALFARKKYCADVKYIKTDKAQCKRLLSDKEWLYKKVSQLECPLNSYVIKGTEIPQEALALYISVNPRNLFKATTNSLIKLAQLLANKYNGYNPLQEVMSEIHKSKGRKIYFDYDFDNVEVEPVLDQFCKFLNIEALTIIKTRGGFHVLVGLHDIHEDCTKSWYQKAIKIEGCDVRGDNLIPVVGCTQGNFIPYFMMKNGKRVNL